MPALSSAFLFARYVRLAAVLPYVLVVMAIAGGCVYFASTGVLERSVARPKSLAFGALVVIMLGLIAAYAVLHPLALERQLNGHGSDAEPALNMATRALFQGQFPYSQKTYLNNPITPMPGSLVLAAPSVFIFGTSAVLNLVALAVFLRVLPLYFRPVDAVLAAVFGVIAVPTLVYDLAIGEDYLANSVAVLTVVVLVDHWRPETPARWRVLTAIFAGLAFSSRLSFASVGALLLGLAAFRAGRAAAVQFAVVAGATFLGITLPIYLADPANFSPLHTYGILNQFDGVIPHFGLILPGLIVVLGLALGWLIYASKLAAAHALLACAAVLSLPVLAGVVLNAAVGRDWLDFASFGALTVVFWAAGWHSLVYAWSDRPIIDATGRLSRSRSAFAQLLAPARRRPHASV